MTDPTFLQCLAQHSHSDPADYVNIVATCYGFVGRPRYGIKYTVYYTPLQHILTYNTPHIQITWGLVDILGGLKKENRNLRVTNSQVISTYISLFVHDSRFGKRFDPVARGVPVLPQYVADSAEYDW